MSENTAEELAATLESWTTQDGTPIQARGGKGSGDLAFWREQADTVAQVRALDEAAERLTGGGPNFYAPSAEQWYRAAFSFSSGWNAKGHVPPPPAEAVAMLRALGVTLKFEAGGRKPVPHSQTEALTEVIDEAVGLLREADSLSEQESLYLFEMLTATRRLLEENELVDRVDLQRHLDQLFGALARLAASFSEVGKPEDATKFTQMAKKVYDVGRSVVYDTAAVAAIGSAAIEIVKAITS